MDIGGILGKTWKKAAMIAVIWAIIAGVIGLVPIVNVIAALVTLPLAFIIPVVVGYLAIQDYSNSAKTDAGTGALTGILSGLVYGVVSGIVGIVFVILNFFFGLGITSAIGGAEAAAGVAALGIMELIFVVLIGLPFGIAFNVVLALIGGLIYSVIKK